MKTISFCDKGKEPNQLLVDCDLAQKLGVSFKWCEPVLKHISF